MPLTKSGHEPTSTYRVQLHGRFTFADLSALTPYFSGLGISDLYLSPIFAAVPGSQHGYDVTDYSEVNPELGGLGGFRQLAAAQRALDGSIILDFVPNHMGIAGMLNQWWRDVLEFGPLSQHASFFDIQWNSDSAAGHPRVLVPILLDHYGKVLEQGELKLVYDHGFSIRYGETALPVRPDSYRDILGPLDALADRLAEGRAVHDLITRFSESRQVMDARHGDIRVALARESAALRSQLDLLMAGSPDLQARLAERLRVLNGTAGDARSFDPLHALIEHQHYRLARWQAGAHEINYRRFFAIDTLVGLHMENPEVFRECHAMVGRLLADGQVAGLRIDHIDGLRQPQDYLRRLQGLPRADPSLPLYVLAEKILNGRERLPENWPVHGTTGYEFIPQLSGILVDRTQAAVFDGLYGRFTGETRTYADLVRRAKRLIIAEMFANAISNLGAELVQIVAEDRLWRDLTRHELTTAVSEFVVHLPVYRTYRRKQEAVSAQDRAVLEQACADSVAGNPRADPQPFTFLRDLLTGAYPPAEAPEAYRERILGWILTFQQYTGAIMAKSVEDTTFYNYNRLVALNEVGSDPGSFGGTVEEFHRANADRLAQGPLALLTTSTHDSKFSEDVRARLYALSELGPEWEAGLNEWRTQTARHTKPVDGAAAPDPLDQYRFFQILLGSWPLAPGEVDDAYRSRLKEYFRKAVDEAKRHTSILNRNEDYIAACEAFVDGITTPGAAPDFLASFTPLADRIARLGMVNSLVQLVLKCTVPGVPDFYQGNETWDFSLVDPDNRRPVDFERRRTMMEAAGKAALPALLENWRDGALKLRVTRELLRLRREVPGLFSAGTYQPVAANGSFGDHVVAFTRTHGGESLLVAVPRLTATLGSPPVGAVWDDTWLAEVDSAAGWQDLLTGGIFPPRAGVYLRSLFAELPFAVLRSPKAASPPPP
jgi:(1->4)-alpha-D-glucan 1-alpha-D-glucosylmutase